MAGKSNRISAKKLDATPSCPSCAKTVTEDFFSPGLYSSDNTVPEHYVNAAEDAEPCPGSGKATVPRHLAGHIHEVKKREFGGASSEGERAVRADAIVPLHESNGLDVSGTLTEKKRRLVSRKSSPPTGSPDHLKELDKMSDWELDEALRDSNGDYYPVVSAESDKDGNLVPLGHVHHDDSTPEHFRTASEGSSWWNASEPRVLLTPEVYRAIRARETSPDPEKPGIDVGEIRSRRAQSSIDSARKRFTTDYDFRESTENFLGNLLEGHKSRFKVLKKDYLQKVREVSSKHGLSQAESRRLADIVHLMDSRENLSEDQSSRAGKASALIESVRDRSSELGNSMMEDMVRNDEGLRDLVQSKFSRRSYLYGHIPDHGYVPNGADDAYSPKELRFVLSRLRSEGKLPNEDWDVTSRPGATAIDRLIEPLHELMGGVMPGKSNIQYVQDHMSGRAYGKYRQRANSTHVYVPGTPGKGKNPGIPASYRLAVGPEGGTDDVGYKGGLRSLRKQLEEHGEHMGSDDLYRLLNDVSVPKGLQGGGLGYEQGNSASEETPFSRAIGSIDSQISLARSSEKKASMALDDSYEDFVIARSNQWGAYGEAQKDRREVLSNDSGLAKAKTTGSAELSLKGGEYADSSPTRVDELDSLARSQEALKEKIAAVDTAKAAFKELSESHGVFSGDPDAESNALMEEAVRGYHSYLKDKYQSNPRAFDLRDYERTGEIIRGRVVTRDGADAMLRAKAEKELMDVFRHGYIPNGRDHLHNYARKIADRMEETLGKRDTDGKMSRFSHEDAVSAYNQDKKDKLEGDEELRKLGIEPKQDEFRLNLSHVALHAILHHAETRKNNPLAVGIKGLLPHAVTEQPSQVPKMDSQGMAIPDENNKPVLEDGPPVGIKELAIHEYINDPETGESKKTGKILNVDLRDHPADLARVLLGTIGEGKLKNVEPALRAHLERLDAEDKSLAKDPSLAETFHVDSRVLSPEVRNSLSQILQAGQTHARARDLLQLFPSSQRSTMSLHREEAHFASLRGLHEAHKSTESEIAKLSKDVDSKGAPKNPRALSAQTAKLDGLKNQIDSMNKEYEGRARTASSERAVLSQQIASAEANIGSTEDHNLKIVAQEHLKGLVARHKELSAQVASGDSTDGLSDLEKFHNSAMAFTGLLSAAQGGTVDSSGTGYVHVNHDGTVPISDAILENSASSRERMLGLEPGGTDYVDYGKVHIPTGAMATSLIHLLGGRVRDPSHPLSNRVESTRYTPGNEYTSNTEHLSKDSAGKVLGEALVTSNRLAEVVRSAANPGFKEGTVNRVAGAHLVIDKSEGAEERGDPEVSVQALGQFKRFFAGSDATLKSLVPVPNSKPEIINGRLAGNQGVAISDATDLLHGSYAQPPKEIPYEAVTRGVHGSELGSVKHPIVGSISLTADKDRYDDTGEPRQPQELRAPTGDQEGQEGIRILPTAVAKSNLPAVSASRSNDLRTATGDTFLSPTKTIYNLPENNSTSENLDAHILTLHQGLRESGVDTHGPEGRAILSQHMEQLQRDFPNQVINEDRMLYPQEWPPHYVNPSKTANGQDHDEAGQINSRKSVGVLPQEIHWDIHGKGGNSSRADQLEYPDPIRVDPVNGRNLAVPARRAKILTHLSSTDQRHINLSKYQVHVRTHDGRYIHPPEGHDHTSVTSSEDFSNLMSRIHVSDKDSVDGSPLLRLSDSSDSVSEAHPGNSLRVTDSPGAPWATVAAATNFRLPSVVAHTTPFPPRVASSVVQGHVAEFKRRGVAQPIVHERFGTDTEPLNRTVPTPPEPTGTEESRPMPPAESAAPAPEAPALEAPASSGTPPEGRNAHFNVGRG